MRVPKKYRTHWARPYTKDAREDSGFCRWLLRKGYLSPHFTIAEAMCHDGTNVPKSLLPKAQKHAFNLEQLRNRLGGRPLHILSWYRTPSYNQRVGGVPNSQHLWALATDFDVQFVNSIPGFDSACDFVFSHGGFGQYPGGSRHVDSRGYRARWTSA